MTEEEPAESGGDGGGWAAKSRPARYIAVLVILVGSAVALQWGPPFCRQVVAHTEVRQLCAPPGLTDLPTLLVLGLIAVLLLPDLSELELAGVVKLKRQVARAEARTAEVAAEVASLKATAVAASMASSVAAPVTTINFGASQLLGAAEALTRGQVDVPPSTELPAPARAAGQAAAVAFDAVMLGLRASVAENLAWEEVTLVGCTLDDAGQPQITHVAGDDDLLEAVEELLQDDDVTSTLAVRIGDGLYVSAPAVAAEVGLVGVLVAVVAEIEPVDDDSKRMVEVAQTVGAAAGAYAQALHRLLGELPASG